MHEVFLGWKQVFPAEQGVPATGQRHNIWAAATQAAVHPSCPTPAVSSSISSSTLMVWYLHQLDRLHHLNERRATCFLKLMTSNVTTGASAIIQQCESKNKYETSLKRKEASGQATARGDVPGIGPRRVPPVQPDQGRGALSRRSSDRRPHAR